MFFELIRFRVSFTLFTLAETSWSLETAGLAVVGLRNLFLAPVKNPFHKKCLLCYFFLYAVYYFSLRIVILSLSVFARRTTDIFINWRIYIFLINFMGLSAFLHRESPFLWDSPSAFSVIPASKTKHNNAATNGLFICNRAGNSKLLSN